MCQSNTLQAADLAGLCFAASLPPSTSLLSKREAKRNQDDLGGEGELLRGGAAGREGRREGGEGGTELKLLPPPRCRHRATVNTGGCGRERSAASELRSWGAEEKGSSRSGRPLGSRRQSPGPAAAAPAAPQQSVRLLLQLRAVEALRRGKARRREGRGGMKAARRLPGGGGQNVWVL